MSQATSHAPGHFMAGIVGHRELPWPTVHVAESAVQAGSAHATACDERRRESRTESRKRRASERLHEPYAAPPTWDHLCVAERTAQRFVVSCKQCGRHLMTVVRITDPDIARLEAHIRACVRTDPLDEAPPLGAIMALIRVTAGDA